MCDEFFCEGELVSKPFSMCLCHRVRFEGVLILDLVQEAEFRVLYEKIGLVGRGTITEAAQGPSAVE